MTDPGHELNTPDFRDFPRQSSVRSRPRRADGEIPRTQDPSYEHLRIQQEALTRRNEALERERQKYFELFEFAPDAYLITDSRGVITEANVAASHLLAVPAQFLVGKPLPAFFDETGRRSFHQQLDRLCGCEQLDDWEITLQARNGVSVPIAVSIGRIAQRDKRIVGYRWILRDITKRKQAEDIASELNRQLEFRVASRTTQLAAANKVKDELLASERAAREQAEASNRVKSEFLSLVSHEFRTPLQAILGYAELLEREIHGPLTEPQRRDLQRIQQSHQHLLGLINRILEFAKLESADGAGPSLRAAVMTPSPSSASPPPP